MPGLKQLGSLYLRVGSTTFGGGDPTMAVLQREFLRRGWVTAEQFALVFGLARVTPGTNVTAFCAGTGWLMRGIPGAIAAVLGLTIPSAVLVIWLTRMCEIGAMNHWSRAMIAGTVAAAVGTMLGAVVMLTRPQLTRRGWLPAGAIVLAAFLLARLFGLSAIQILGLAAIVGLAWKR